MSNGLAGGFDAVVLIRLEVVNCILGTLHQNGASRRRLAHVSTLDYGADR